MRRLFTLVFIAFLSLFNVHAAPEAQEYTTLPNCTYVPNEWNDGDSFHVRTANGKEFIFRLYFVDTPESEDSLPDRVAEQAEYFKLSPEQSIKTGVAAKAFTKSTLSKPFTIITRWHDAFGRSTLPRFYAFVKVGPDYLQDLLVKNGLARIFGSRTQSLFQLLRQLPPRQPQPRRPLPPCPIIPRWSI